MGNELTASEIDDIKIEVQDLAAIIGAYDAGMGWIA
jgi:hypothetical protein